MRIDCNALFECVHYSWRFSPCVLICFSLWRLSVSVPHDALLPTIRMPVFCILVDLTRYVDVICISMPGLRILSITTWAQRICPVLVNCWMFVLSLTSRALPAACTEQFEPESAALGRKLSCCSGNTAAPTKPSDKYSKKPCNAAARLRSVNFYQDMSFKILNSGSDAVHLADNSNISKRCAAHCGRPCGGS